MKKNLIILAGMAVLISAVSCSIEESNIDPIPADPRVPMTFTAGEFTKTSLVPGDNENAVHWSAGDAISIFDGTNNNEFTLTEGAGTASAKFEGEAVPDQTYYALYPYSETASLSGTTITSITSSLPAEQQYVGATFDTMLNPSVAVADGDNNLAFHNVASILQINVSGLKSKSVREIQISADKSLTGEYTVDMSGNAFSASASGTEISGVRLLVDSADMETDPNFNGSISCYAVVLPGTYANLKISVIYSDNSYSEKSFENVTLVASDGNYVNVNASQATANEQGLYGLFMAGQDIYIGGKAYNKSQYSDDEIVYVTKSMSIYSGSKVSYDGKIFFIDIEDPESPVTLGNIGDVVIIGSNPSNKPLLVKSDRYLNAPSNLSTSELDKGRVVLYNLTLDFSEITNASNGNYRAFVVNSVFGELTFDNCDILLSPNVVENVNGANAMIALTSSSRSVDEINIMNCNIRVPAASENYIFFSGSTSQTMNSFVFSNNIVYCYPQNEATSNFALIRSALSTDQAPNQGLEISSINIENNTFINTNTASNFAVYTRQIGNVSIVDNLAWSEQLSSNSGILRYSSIQGGTASHNLAYVGSYTGEQARAWQICYGGNSGLFEGAEQFTVLRDDEDPFNGGTFDFDNVVFVPNTTYASYGAQR